MTPEITVTFRVSPGGPFGVPEKGKTVSPATPGEHYSETLHVRAGVVTGHPTLSTYREQAERLNLEVTADSIRIRFVDNFAFVRVPTNDPSSALPAAVNALDRLLQRLTLDQGRPFDFEALIIEDEAKRLLFPVPSMLRLSGLCTYNLEELAASVARCARSVSTTDERLERALVYFDHAVFLWESTWSSSNPLARRSSMVISAIFLNFWKAVTAILGDPAKRQDRFQRRYRDLGFGKDIKTKVDSLKRIRDDSDVAHYALDNTKQEEVSQAVGRARSIAREVILAYQSQLTEALGCAGQPTPAPAARRAGEA